MAKWTLSLTGSGKVRGWPKSASIVFLENIGACSRFHENPLFKYLSQPKWTDKHRKYGLKSYQAVQSNHSKDGDILAICTTNGQL